MVGIGNLGGPGGVGVGLGITVFVVDVLVGSIVTVPGGRTVPTVVLAVIDVDAVCANASAALASSSIDVALPVKICFLVIRSIN